MSMNTLLGTPYGPTTTLGRNLASVGALFLGLGCVVLPSLQGVPPSRSLIFAAVGAVLVGVFLFHVLRWKGILRHAAKDAKGVDARGVAAFMQAKIIHEKSGKVDYSGPGWLLIMDDRIVIRYRRALAGSKSDEAHHEVLFRDVVSVSRNDTTSISYTALIIVTATGEQQFFTLAPENGSGWRGSSEEETDNVLRCIQERIKAQH